MYVAAYKADTSEAAESRKYAVIFFKHQKARSFRLGEIFCVVLHYGGFVVIM